MESTKIGANEGATLLAFRRRRKKLIAIFSTFLVFLALTIAALITFLIRDSDSGTFNRTATVDPSLQAFCSAVDSTPSCLASLDPIIYTKPVTNPNQIFALSLETATEELENLISLLSNSTDQSNLGGCSSSLREGLNRINGTFSFEDQLQRYGVMDRIEAAEEDLKGCAADPSEKVRWTAAGGVERARMFLGYSRDFLARYDDVLLVSDAPKYSSGWHLLRKELEENVFAIVLFGSQLLFLGFLFCSVLRIR